MPEITFEQTSPVQGRLQLSLPREEISQKLNEALKQEKKRVNIKGFRRGKTPLSALRKLMGNQVLGPLLDREIQSALFGYVEENELELIFSPLPVEDDEAPILTATSLHDLKLTYDLALRPDIDLKLPEETFTQYVLDTNDEFLDEQITNLRKQMGENVEVEDGEVRAGDVIDVTLREDGDGELENSPKLYVDSLSDEAQAEFIGKKVGDAVTVSNLAELEPNSTDSYVRKYLLELEDEDETDLVGKTFTATIDKISRVEPAEMDEDFFTKFDPTGGVTDEEGLRAKIAEDNAAGFNDQGVSMLNYELQRALVEGNDIELPTELMQRIHAEDASDGYESFERGVRWMLLRGELSKKAGYELQYDDLKEEATKNLLRMLGGQRPDFLTDDFIDNYVGNMLQDEEQRNQLTQTVIEHKTMAYLRERVTVAEQPLSADEFNERIKTFNEENTPAGGEEE